MSEFSFVSTMGNPITILFIFFFVFFLFIGSFVFSKNTKFIHNVFFLFLCISFAIVCFGEIFFSWSIFKEDAYFFHAVSSIGFFSFWPMIQHFFLLLREKKINKIWMIYIGLSYIFVIFIVVTVFAGITVSRDYIRDQYTWIDVISDNLIYNRIYLPFIFPTWVILTFYIIISTRSEAKKNGNAIKRKQFDIILNSGIVTFIYGVSFSILFPLFGLKVPAVGHFSTGFWIIFVGYAITKYKLLIPTAEYASKFLLENASEIVVITDIHGFITFVNNKFYEFYQIPINYFNHSKMHFDDLIGNGYSIKNEFEAGFTGKKEFFIITKKFQKYFNLTFEIMKYNNFNVGIGIIFSDITDLKNQNEVLEQKVKERTEELQKEKDESEKRLSITETYTRKSLVHRIEDGFDPRTIEPEEKKVAIMFSDIRHFTSISEHLSPRKTVNLLNSYFNEINNCVIGSSNKGEIDKIIGDAVMAIFDNSKSAIDAAIDIRRCLPKLNNYTQKEYNIKIDNGIGINFGSVTYGNIGSDQKLDFTVIGDSVNLASRIEELTKYYNVPILISEATMQNINCDDYKIRFIDEIKVKGKENSTKIFEIFDYEREDIIEMKQNNQHYLDEAFKLYQIADFDNALKIYKKLEMEMPRHKYNPKFPADSVLTFYIARCQRFIKLRHDRPEMIQNWSGVYSFVVK